MVYKISKLLIKQHGAKNFMVMGRKFSTVEPILITNEIGDKGQTAIVTINRPKYMNSLTYKLNHEFYTTMKMLEKLKSLVIIKGAGNKAFCTGGDLMELSLASKQQNMNYFNGFATHLNGLLDMLNTYKIPVVAFADGFTFGAGTGLCVFSKYSIVTERTSFMMPEVRLGAAPNGGASYYFNNRTKGKLGYFMALTGHSLQGSDLVQAGLATHYTESSNLPKLETALIMSSTPEEVKEILDSSCEKNLPEFSMAPLLEKIDNCFSEPSVEEIISKLKEDGSKWAQKTLSVMEKGSPTALKVILKQMQRGKDKELKDCLHMEVNLGKLFESGPDVHEGVRVALVDKDSTPKWNPPTLSDVTDQMVEQYFREQTRNFTHFQRGVFNARYSSYY